ncbi:hypothetical protein OZX57_04435 [Bifidobacterium sp. ESL0682]|uniref:hypothetical protein n=1 Tax=Bifidobacterium sp. ESL0682 TaxID=2983212 RepID=UPI0023F7193B|nr:hypothetical protein [Bifidobacterium sp. ESL0682]WEV42652.1 hypothetical protein OZX57_04435 [Bifidobacterium sp. ESL0682]
MTRPLAAKVDRVDGKFDNDNRRINKLEQSGTRASCSPARKTTTSTSISYRSDANMSDEASTGPAM